ncbi:MAG: crossover junction endodeoxyribonuclease RuvC [Patescibacteria group bacterium]
MIILGIDPGIARTGWGILETRGSKLEARGFGCIETSAKQNVADRLKEIHDEILNIIKTYSPDVLAIEELFFNTNAKTALIVGHARGVILLCAAQAGLEIESFTPLEVKIAITGYGRAEKAQMGKMVKAVLNLKEVPKPDDTVDALAIALSCAFSNKDYLK